MDSRSYIPFLFLTLSVFIMVFRLRSSYVEPRKIHGCSYFSCSSRILGSPFPIALFSLLPSHLHGTYYINSLNFSRLVMSRTFYRVEAKLTLLRRQCESTGSLEFFINISRLNLLQSDSVKITCQTILFEQMQWFRELILSVYLLVTVIGLCNVCLWRKNIARVVSAQRRPPCNERRPTLVHLNSV